MASWVSSDRRALASADQHASFLQAAVNTKRCHFATGVHERERRDGRAAAAEHPRHAELRARVRPLPEAELHVVEQQGLPRPGRGQHRLQWPTRKPPTAPLRSSLCPLHPALSSDSVSLRRVLRGIRPGSTSTCDNAFSAVLSSFACAEHGRLVCNRTGSVAART